MIKCKDCGSEMKPLFVGVYCPNQCDLPLEKRKIKLVDMNAMPRKITYRGQP